MITIIDGSPHLKNAVFNDFKSHFPDHQEIEYEVLDFVNENGQMVSIAALRDEDYIACGGHGIDWVLTHVHPTVNALYKSEEFWEFDEELAKVGALYVICLSSFVTSEQYRQMWLEFLDYTSCNVYLLDCLDVAHYKQNKEFHREEIFKRIRMAAL